VTALLKAAACYAGTIVTLVYVHHLLRQADLRPWRWGPQRRDWP